MHAQSEEDPPLYQWPEIVNNKITNIRCLRKLEAISNLAEISLSD